MGDAGVAFGRATQSYDTMLKRVCDVPTATVGTVGSAVTADCFDPRLRDFDFMSTSRHLTEASMHLLRFLPRQCTILQQPLVILLYPFSDTSLGYAVHHFINVFVQFVQAWVIAFKRVQETKRLVFLSADLGPVFDHLVAGIMRLGQVVDNWLDVAFYASYAFFDPSITLVCDEQDGSWDFDARSRFGFFGENRTAVVSLTPSMFAVTDGYDVEYHHHGRRGGVRPSHVAWPLPVNVTYGIAAVAYARDMSRDVAVEGHTTALFGCSCVDDVALGMQLLCAIVPYEVYEGAPAGSFLVNVTWEVANTPKRLSCRDTKIAVQSIRHPTTRFTSPNEFRFGTRVRPPVTCFTSASCTVVDAAIWIMPVCPVYRVPGMPPGDDSACVRGLRDFSCFPFCMGLHRSFAANEPILVRRCARLACLCVLYATGACVCVDVACGWVSSSSTWEDTVTLSSRDCVFERAVGGIEGLTSVDSLHEQDGGSGTWMLATRHPVANLESHMGERVKFRVGSASADARVNCTYNPSAVSSVPAVAAQRYNSSRMFQDLHAFAKGWEHANDEPGDLYRFTPTVAMLVDSQPFVFAGDFAIRTMSYCEDAVLWDASADAVRKCTTVLDVLRVGGSEHNEFQIVHAVPTGMPVTRRPTTIAQTTEVLREGAGLFLLLSSAAAAVPRFFSPLLADMSRGQSRCRRSSFVVRVCITPPPPHSTPCGMPLIPTTRCCTVCSVTAVSSSAW